MLFVFIDARRCPTRFPDDMFFYSNTSEVGDPSGTHGEKF